MILNSMLQLRVAAFPSKLELLTGPISILEGLVFVPFPIRRETPPRCMVVCNPLPCAHNFIFYKVISLGIQVSQQKESS